MKRTGFLSLLGALPLVGAAFKDDSPGRLEMPHAPTVTEYATGVATKSADSSVAYTSVMLGTYTTCAYYPTQLWRKDQYAMTYLDDNGQPLSNAPGQVIHLTSEQLKSRFPK